MTAHVTFNGTTISTKQVTRMVIEASRRFEIDFDCVATSLSEITTLAGYYGPTRVTRVIGGNYQVLNPLGTTASLIVNGVTYTNCIITNLESNEAYGSLFGVWPYKISFVKNTAT